MLDTHSPAALDGMVTTDPVLAAVFERIRRVASSSESVLVLGETGTGKEGIAAALHRLSGRRGRFEPLNCGSLRGELASSELFGHERGAFTGADRQRSGVFERARSGTVFLDEIGELDGDVQAGLLRVLETRKVRRLGGGSAEHYDFRLVCATHRDLVSRVASHRFRRDLFYRVGVIVVQLPPLRDRSHDVPLLAQRFLAETRPGAHFSSAALRRLRGRRWEGNVRELRNVVKRVAVELDHSEVGVSDLERLTDTPGGLGGLGDEGGGVVEAPVPGQVHVLVGGRPLSAVRRDVIRHELSCQRGNVAAAARVLGIARSTVYSALR